MQPFGRPTARAVWRHGGIGLELAARPRPGVVASRGITTTRWPPTTCLRCHVQVIVSPARFYSSQPPLTDSDKPVSPPQPTSTAANATPTASSSSTSSGTASSAASRSFELPSVTDLRRSVVNKKFSHVMDNLQSRVLNASQTLNEITGYTGIEAIKVENETLETALADAQSRVRLARQAYKTSNTKRATTQREVTTLLARKDSWSPTDLERFTELYRTDHVLEGEVVAAQEALTESETDEQKLNQKLSAGILKRYHEEQIWSDRIRRASTWGTWGLMGMNFILFVMLQFIAEPWKRKRLVKGVVEEEKRALDELRAELAAVKASLDKMAEAAEARAAAAEAPPPPKTATIKDWWCFATVESTVGTWMEIVQDTDKWRPALEDLYSERKLELRMRDVSILALEGAVTGAAMAASIALLFGRR